MLCRTMNLHNHPTMNGQYEFLISVYWYATMMADKYGCDTMNCQMQIFLEISIMHGMMALREKFDKNKARQCMHVKTPLFRRQCGFQFYYTNTHEPNNVFNKDNILLTKRNLALSMSNVLVELPYEVQKMRLRLSVKLLREVHDQWVQEGKKSHYMFDKHKKSMLTDLEVAEKNLEMFKMKVKGKKVETREEKLKKLKAKIKEARK